MTKEELEKAKTNREYHKNVEDLKYNFELAAKDGIKTSLMIALADVKQLYDKEIFGRIINDIILAVDSEMDRLDNEFAKIGEDGNRP